MTAEKYIKHKQQYQEGYPNFNNLSNAERIYLQRQAIRKANKKSNKKVSSNSLLKAKNNSAKTYFKDLNKQVDLLHSRSKGLLGGLDNILNIVLLASVALFGLSKYTEIKEKAYNPEYSPIGTGAGDYSGDNTGHMSREGKEQLKKDEGCVLYAYDDKDGYWPHKKNMPGDPIKGTLTIGYGHTGKDVKQGMVISQAEADALLDKDIIIHENRVKDQLKKHGITTKVSQKQFDAMVNYAFNRGSLGEKFLAKLKAGDYLGASTELEVGGANKKRMDNLQKAFREDVTSDNKLKAAPMVVDKTSSAGKIHRYANKTNIGGYEMYNPVAHDGKYYIDLSERAEAYLKDVGGKGRISSGAEGVTHKQGKTMSHGAGNKIDVIAYNSNSDAEWAEIAIPFLKNKNTAFVCFEDFSTSRYESIKAIIFSKIDDELKKKCNSYAEYAWGRGHTFLCHEPNYKTGLHLDIGILPNAYSKQSYKEEEKDIKNQQKIKENKAKLEEQEKKRQAQEAEKTRLKAEQAKKNSNNTTSLIKGNQPSTNDNRTLQDKSVLSPIESIKRKNTNYRNARK